jgi:hypothetical protein
MKWHYYMGKLTGKSGYTKQADHMADMLWDNEIISATSPSGVAYVWNRSVLSEGGSQNYLHPTVYARYVYADVTEFYLEGYDKWANETNMERFARTIAEWVIDYENRGTDRSDKKDWFSGDIGGDVPRAGIRSDDWSRMYTYRWESSPYAQMAAWDSSGRIRDISIDVLEDVSEVDKPRAIYIPAGIFLQEMLD